MYEIHAVNNYEIRGIKENYIRLCIPAMSVLVIHQLMNLSLFPLLSSVYTIFANNHT